MMLRLIKNDSSTKRDSVTRDLSYEMVQIWRRESLTKAQIRRMLYLFRYLIKDLEERFEDAPV